MEKREFHSKKRYLLAWGIGTLIFIAVLLLSYSISYLEFNRISNSQGLTAYSIFENKLIYSFPDENICSQESFRKVSEDLGFQGRIIDDLERKFGKNDAKVLFQKKFYSVIELEHFYFVNLLNEKCNSGINTILFFYSNLEEDSEESNRVGDLLSVAYNRNENISIYSFDVNLDSLLIKKLKEEYGVEKSPTIIINKEHKITSPQNIEEIETYLN